MEKSTPTRYTILVIDFFSRMSHFHVSGTPVGLSLQIPPIWLYDSLQKQLET